MMIQEQKPAKKLQLIVLNYTIRYLQKKNSLPSVLVFRNYIQIEVDNPCDYLKNTGCISALLLLVETK